MIKKTFLGVLFSVVMCSVYGQVQDTAAQGENEVVEESSVAVSQNNGEKRSRLTVAIKNVSQTDEGEQRHNRLLWNDGHWAGIGIHYSGLADYQLDAHEPSCRCGISVPKCQVDRSYA